LSNLDDTIALNEARGGPFCSSTKGSSSAGLAGLNAASSAASPDCPSTKTSESGEGQSPAAVVYALPLNWCDWQPVDERLARDGEDPGSSHRDGCVGAPAKNVWHLPSTPRPLGGGCFDLILGSELVYAPHHRCLADLIVALLRAHRDQEPPLDAPQACCVMVQREDRPGWAHFLARARTLGLAVRQAMTFARAPLPREWGFRFSYLFCVLFFPTCRSLCKRSRTPSLQRARLRRMHE
jgi:hypothetical protein